MDTEVQKDGSEIVRIQPSLTCEKGKHHFIYKSSQEIICTKCPIGYPISGGTEVKDGRVMIHGQLVI